MATMSSQDQAAAQKALTGEVCDAREPIAITRPQLAAAVAAVDQWVSDNTASFNSALPAAARSSLTASQKARLLLAVVRQRFVVGA